MFAFLYPQGELAKMFCIIDNHLEFKGRKKLAESMGQFTETKRVMAFAKAIPLVTAECKDVELRWTPKFGQVVKSGFCSYNEYGIGGEHETEPKKPHPIIQSQGSHGSIKG